MDNNNQAYTVGIMLQLIPLAAVVFGVYYLVLSFGASAAVPVAERSAVLSQEIGNSMRIFGIAAIAGFFSFLYIFMMLGIGQKAVARKLRKMFFILGVFSLWGGLIPLLIMIFTGKYFEESE
jgi:hypothetical protein